jgi:monothiol glutaredoxin
MTNSNSTPTELPSVKELTAPQLKTMLERGEVTLFDVRPPAERARAAVAAARSLDGNEQEYLFGLARDTPIAFLCHHGIRSRSAADYMIEKGFIHVYNVTGGIEAWSLLVDPSVPRY